jgi:transposase
MSQKLNSAVAVIGIDIGKNSFHIVGHDKHGAIVLRQKWSRGQVEARLANMQPCLIGMEACVGAHHLSRKLQMLGHDARMMPAKYVRPYSKGQKNDFRDAEAIAEAVQRPTMKFVATKTADQLDLQALHRVRQRLVSQRTGIINQIRAFLLERGVAVRQGLRFLRAELPSILAKRTDVLSPRMSHLLEECWQLRSPTSSLASPGRFSTKGARCLIFAPCSRPSRRGLAIFEQAEAKRDGQP